MLKWLRLEDKAINLDDQTINMDFITGFRVHKIGKHLIEDKEVYCVLMFPLNNEPFIACQGSEEKCRLYVNKLNMMLDATMNKIMVYETHRCECPCGCHADVIEGFSICDDCEDGFHFDNDAFEKAQQLKKDAA